MPSLSYFALSSAHRRSTAEEELERLNSNSWIGDVIVSTASSLLAASFCKPSTVSAAIPLFVLGVNSNMQWATTWSAFSGSIETASWALSMYPEVTSRLFQGDRERLPDESSLDKRPSEKSKRLSTETDPPFDP